VCIQNIVSKHSVEKDNVPKDPKVLAKKPHRKSVEEDARTEIKIEKKKVYARLSSSDIMVVTIVLILMTLSFSAARVVVLSNIDHARSSPEALRKELSPYGHITSVTFPMEVCYPSCQLFQRFHPLYLFSPF
jgi:hypothetical protein